MVVNFVIVSLVCFLTKLFELNILIQTPKNLIDPSSGLMCIMLDPNLICTGCEFMTVFVSNCDLDLLIAAFVIE